jgi:localization factor PodJL
MESLEARLADIANRLDMSSTGQAGPSDEALRGLEDQIANLSRLDQFRTIGSRNRGL